MIMWPVDPKTTGSSLEPKQTGTWIMWDRQNFNFTELFLAH